VYLYVVENKTTPPNPFVFRQNSVQDQDANKTCMYASREKEEDIMLNLPGKNKTNVQIKESWR
jgi:hypothetical protein